eukprot:736793-Hanusia_phi.AAC.1
MDGQPCGWISTRSPCISPLPLFLASSHLVGFAEGCSKHPAVKLPGGHQATSRAEEVNAAQEGPSPPSPPSPLYRLFLLPPSPLLVPLLTPPLSSLSLPPLLSRPPPLPLSSSLSSSSSPSLLFSPLSRASRWSRSVSCLRGSPRAWYSTMWPSRLIRL